ncbi:MAG: dUTP diphosphatase [Enterobacterales bacterium]
MMKKIKIKILDQRIGKEFPLPSCITYGSSGLDLRACINSPICIDSNKTMIINTGFAIHINNINVTALILPRSGIGHKHGIVLSNLVGVIDSDYQGEIMVALWNRSNKKFFVYPGNRIAQMIFIPIIKTKFDIVKSFDEITLRSKKSFGHSGVK